MPQTPKTRPDHDYRATRSLRGRILREPIDDPELRDWVAAYLADQQAITARYHRARTTAERDPPLYGLLRHADTNTRLINEVTK